MKTSTLFIFFVLAMLQSQAQDYLIGFAGTGESNTVDSVQVNNLTQNTRLTLNGTDVLHLMGVVGIDQAIAQANVELCIYPNPMKEVGFVEFESVSSGNATIELCDITGKQIAQTQTMLTNGRHTFSVSDLKGGVYILNIKSAGYVYSGKIVCANTVAGNGKISYVSSKLKSSGQSGLKSVQATVPMQYNDGDQLIFKCFSGIYKSVTPLIPVQSQTVTSNFVACTDADDNNYATVTVGSQVWMAENLNVGIRIDGVQEQTNNGINEKYCYNNDVTKCDIYGGLYQWHEIMQYVITPGVQGICPTGWHIPTDEEWFILTIFLGGDSIAGGKIKSTGTIEAGTGLWHDPNTEAANAYGLTAVPGSYRDLDGTFYGIGYYSIWWSSFQSGNDSAWVRVLDYNYGGVSRDDDDRSYGFSVRCLKE